MFSIVILIVCLDSTDDVSIHRSQKQTDRLNKSISTKTSSSIALIVKPSTSTIDQRSSVSTYDNDDEFERTKHNAQHVQVSFNVFCKHSLRLARQSSEMPTAVINVLLHCCQILSSMFIIYRECLRFHSRLSE
jgi:hypothetical protein